MGKKEYYNPFLRRKMKRDIVDLSRTTFGKMVIRTESAADIYQHILHPPKDKPPSRNKLPSANNITEFKIVSPFYDRNKICKTKNCLCPYHKRVRQQTYNKKHRLKTNKQPNSAIPSPTKPDTILSYKRFRVTHKPATEQDKENSVQICLKKLNCTIYPEKEISNNELDQFMNLHQKFFQRQQGAHKMTQHVVKVPVREIFDYLYQHLDEERDCIESYLNSIVKDRDFADFYLDRFEDMKQHRTLERKRTRLNTILSKNSHKSIAGLTRNKGEQLMERNSRKASRNSSRIFKSQSPLATRLTRKTNKRTIVKLMIEDLIQNMQEGEEVNRNKVSEFAAMKLNLFQDNCSYLKEKIDIMDTHGLREVKEKILDKIMQELKSQHTQNMGSDINNASQNSLNQSQINKWSQYRKANKEKSQFFKAQLSTLQSSINQGQAKCRADLASLTAKQQMMAQLLDLFNKKLNLIQQKTGIQVQQHKDRVNNIDNSNDIAIDQTQEISRLKKQSLPQQYDQKNSFRRLAQHCEDKNQHKKDSSQTSQTILVDIDKHYAGDKHVKMGRYRKLSHQGFYRQSSSILDKQINLIIPEIHYEDGDHIDSPLSQQPASFQVQWKKIKEIQQRISFKNLKEIAIEDKDSLLTIKRKARVLKQLLKDEVFEGQIKKQVAEYVASIQQIQIIKNQIWVSKKVGKIVKLQDNGIAQIGEILNQDSQYNPIEVIKNIFSDYVWLLFYDLIKTQYKNNEVILENRLFHLMEKDDKKVDKNMKIRNPQKYTSPIEENKTKEKQPSSKYDNLFQTGLRNQCASNLLFSETFNHRSNPPNQSNKLQNSRKMVSLQDSHQIINLVQQFNNSLGRYQYYL